MRNLVFVISLLFLIGCGDGSGNNTDQVTLKATYEIQSSFSYPASNILFDNDSLIVAGGNKARPSGASHDGHVAFSNKVTKINLLTGTTQVLEMNAISGHGETVANGRGDFTKINKIESNKYLISGGFQYVKNMEIADFTNETIKSIDANFTLSDDTGSYPMIYLAEQQGNAVADSGDVFFFGYNGGLYSADTIIKFDKTDENISAVSKLLMSRANTTAHKLLDGRIMIIGGWDGTAEVTQDSATRRVEIFDPTDNSIVRVANYPEPISKGQRPEISPVTNDKICINNYEYTISQDNWNTGCSIVSDTSKVDIEKYMAFQANPATPSHYVGTLSNGDIVMVTPASYSSTFSDELSGYPIEGPTKINVFSQED